MIKVQNLIVEGRGFIPIKEFDIEQIRMFKSSITEFMRKKNYIPNSPSSLIFQDNFLTMTFFLDLNPDKTPLSLKIKEFFRILNKDEVRQEKYFLALKNLRNDIPSSVNISIFYGKHENKRGLFVDVRSEPGVLSKMKQLGLRPDTIDNFKYGLIVDSNKQLIKEIMSAFSLHAVKEPNPIIEHIEAPKRMVVERLERLKFKKTAEFMKRGEKKIESGQIEDGLTDLRASFEVFIKELVKRIDKKPSDKISKNLDILEEFGYLDATVCNLNRRLLYPWLYKYLSDKAVHKREKINKQDARFIFSTSEVIFDHLLDKVVFRL